MPFVFDTIEHGTCPLLTADSRIVCNEEGKCSVNIYSVLVLVSYGDGVLPRQTVTKGFKWHLLGQRLF